MADLNSPVTFISTHLTRIGNQHVLVDIFYSGHIKENVKLAINNDNY